MSEIQGACHCGAVSYRFQSGPLAVVNCHCSLCRCMTGAAFSTYAVVGRDQFVVENKKVLSAFEVTGRVTRHFCSRCGTSIYNVNPADYPGVVMIYLGTLANPEKMMAPVNVFSDSRLGWVDSVKSLRSYSQGMTG